MGDPAAFAALVRVARPQVEAVVRRILPREAAVDVEVLDVVRRAVELLPPGQRDVVLMHYVDDLSCEEIARLLGTSPGAVRVRLHRARAQLRQELAPLAPVPLETTKEERMVPVRVEDVIV